jgi:hypothetical protein
VRRGVIALDLKSTKKDGGIGHRINITSKQLS